MIVIASHVLFDRDYIPHYGIGSALAQHLEHKKIQYEYIKHPLQNGYGTRIEYYRNGKVVAEIRGACWIPFPIRLIQDFIITASVVYRCSQKIDLFIGIDPVNAYFALLLKKTGKVQKVVFYTADWSSLRFNNKILNLIYHVIDKYCIAHADEVWNVSTRMMSLRKSQGVEHIRNKFVPNTPFMIHKSSKHNRINRTHDLIITSGKLDPYLNYDPVIKAVDVLKNRYKDIRLLIIGEMSEYGKHLRRRVKNLNISRYVIFKGVQSHEKLIETVSKSGVGLAMYSGKNSWNEYGDSTKVREYLACGIPVIMTSICPTSADIIHWKAGIVVDDLKTLPRKIDYLFSNINVYNAMKRNALRLGQEYDYSKFLNHLLR